MQPFTLQTVTECRHKHNEKVKSSSNGTKKLSRWLRSLDCALAQSVSADLSKIDALFFISFYFNVVLVSLTTN